MKKFIFPYLFILCFCFVVISSAQEVEEPIVLAKGNPQSPPAGDLGPAPHGEPGILGTDRIFALVDELKLSDEQLNKLREIKKKNKREIEELRHQIKLAMWDIQDEFANKNPDKNKIETAIEKISANQKQLMKLRIEQMFEIKKILTDEQYKKLISLLETGFFKMKREMKKKK